MSFIEAIRESNFLCEEDKDKVKTDSLYTSVLCLNTSSKCRYGLFFTVVEYMTKTITCPHCKEKHDIRCYKNGRVRSRRTLNK